MDADLESGASPLSAPQPIEPSQSHITVVGAGIIGLTSALSLVQRGFRVRVVARETLNATTSAVAGAAWMPFHVAPLSLALKWGAVSLNTFLKQIESAPEAGVRLRKTIVRIRDENVAQWWSNLPLLATTERSQHDDAFRTVEVTLPLIDMPVYLRWLTEQLVATGVSVEALDVNDWSMFDDTTDAIINCTGMGARALTGDVDLHAVRGQVVIVQCPSVEQATIDESHPNGIGHVFPRLDTVVLGGTTELSESLLVDDAATTAIVQRGADLDPRVADATIVDVKVGLRPARSAVRLETEYRQRRIPIVHNYGHGGGGVTLSWGCALEVVSLVEQALGRT